MPHIKARIFGIATFLALTLPPGLAVADFLFPTPTWPVAASPEAENCSTKGFAAYDSWLGARATTRPYGTVVIRHGKIVYQKYGRTTSTLAVDVGSIRKSIATSVVGIAIDENRLASDTVVYTHWPLIYSLSKLAKDKGIELRHLMTMQSGWFDSVGPGVKWLYSNAGSTAAECVVGAAYAKEYGARWQAYGTGRDYIAPMVEDRIRDAIGASWKCSHNSSGFKPLSYHPGPKLIVKSTLLDLARYGYLWLRDGRWGVRQILPRPFLREARMNQSAGLGRNYGYFWITNEGRKTLPAAPADAYWHCGNGANGERTILLVVPSLDLVAACTTHRDDFDLTYRFTAQPASGPAQWAAAILPAILPDPVASTKRSFVSAFFRDGSIGPFDAVANPKAIAQAWPGLDFTGDPVILKLPDRTYTDQTVLLSAGPGFPLGGRVGVLLRGAATAPHLASSDPHVYVNAVRRVTDGKGVLRVLQGSVVLSSAVATKTDLATTRLLLRVSVSGTRLQAWVNGELLANLSGVPNRIGGGYTYLDGRVDPKHAGRVRINYFITRSAADGIVDVSFDGRDHCFLTMVEPGLLGSFQPRAFSFGVGTIQWDLSAFWRTVLTILPGRWRLIAQSPDHISLELGVPFGHMTPVTLEYKGDSETELPPSP